MPTSSPGASAATVLLYLVLPHDTVLESAESPNKCTVVYSQSLLLSLLFSSIKAITNFFSLPAVSPSKNCNHQAMSSNKNQKFLDMIAEAAASQKAKRLDLIVEGSTWDEESEEPEEVLEERIEIKLQLRTEGNTMVTETLQEKFSDLLLQHGSLRLKNAPAHDQNLPNGGRLTNTESGADAAAGP